MRGHASRAVDGDATGGLHSCTILDNFYVDKPTWMVDLGQRTRVSGIKIITWQGKEQGEKRTRDYVLNLDRITVYVDNFRSGVDRRKQSRRQQRRDVDSVLPGDPVPINNSSSSSSLFITSELAAAAVADTDHPVSDGSSSTEEVATAAGPSPMNICGYVSRFNDAVFRPTLHVQCSKPLTGRYVYIEATGVAARSTRLFSAVLCEVMVYV
jgi:hypothetical protein